MPPTLAPARRPYITFSLGQHACPGGSFVRLQATAALRTQAHDLLGRLDAQALGRPPVTDEARLKRIV